MSPLPAPTRTWIFVVALFVATSGVVTASRVVEWQPAESLPPLCLPFFVGGLIAAELLRVRFRRGAHVESLTLFEAVLAPLMFAYDPLTAVVVVGVAQAITAGIRRNPPVKAAFNVAQWVFVTACGTVVLEAWNSGAGLDADSLVALVTSLAVVAVLNNLAVAVVVALSEGGSLPAGLRGFAPLVASSVLGWLVNMLFGLLFVLAVSGSAAAVVLFPVPLVLLHVAYRGYAAAQADGRRLQGLRDAAQALAEPLHPLDAIPRYLDEVRRAFDSRAAVLVLRQDDGSHRTYFHASGGGAEPSDRAATELEEVLSREGEPLRIRAGDAGVPAAAMVQEGSRECMSAPLVDEHQRLGVLAVFDQTGFEGTPAAELAVLGALARETAHTLARGRLFESVLEQERRLAQIVSTTSDGIFTLSDDGSLRTWNAACASITGFTADELVGRRDVMRTLGARTSTGKPIDLANWISMPSLPREILITTCNGNQRRLSCSASPAADADGERSLVVVARDITPAEEYEELREQFSRLVEAQAAQRLVVDHLQKAVAPEPPGIEGADIAVAYVASDPASPTGGDLFDWHEMPSGELHVAVVDVLGHGVTATKDALTVVHTLRFVALEGTPLVDVVRRADELLSAQDSELVATVVVARYDPGTGVLKVVSGGHPPALIVGADGEVTQVSATGGAIGWPAVGSDDVATINLGVNDSVVLYTDGLIEARKDLIEGMDSLMQVAAEIAHMPAQQYADELVRRSLAGADRRDDTLALVLRRTRTRTVSDQARWRLDPVGHDTLRETRRDLEDWLAAHQVEAEDVTLVAAELLANGARAAREAVVMSIRIEAGVVALEVVDDGQGHPGLEELGRRLPATDSESGRGLYLVRALSDDVSVLSTAEGTSVRCVIGVRGLTTASRRLHNSAS